MSVHHYFAIASVMKPTSLKGTQPLENQPAILLNYQDSIFGIMGAAEAVPAKGHRAFHGMVHTVSDADMKVLNEIEHPTPATAELYDGTTTPVTVYCGSGGNENTDEALPQDRYLDIMQGGARHFGVKEEYIVSLGIPTDRKHLTKEHSAYMEHLAVQRLGQDGAKVIGSFVEDG